MKKNIFLLLWCLILGSLSAQNFTGKLNPYPVERTNSIQSDTVKILAVMVSFEEDRDAATFGTGKFGSIYTQDYGNTILDPLPHDQQYFEDHLEFVRNYYNKVSNGNVHIEYTVLPDTFPVSQTMRNYSPAPGSDDFLPLGNFAAEVWSLASAKFSGTNFSDYNLFLIFHAGVGRDITLPGSLGNERDLPSVYLSERALKDIFGQGFDGFTVQGGQFKITNTMIMPETESRELETISGKFLFEITINGLLAASVASHLGLPDLFNTETGLSAIGRFGLMDGQSIFAYNGTYPPEPSAWEKIYLGWAEPVTIAPGEYDISLVTKLAASIADTVILKVPLNSSEYYLVENRNRDAYSDGSTVSFKIGDLVHTKTFTKDTTGYRSFDTDSLAGVVIDVDEFDWAIPGSGILIWHIDENVINEKLASNKINNDKERRGVDLEEADGIQDIGEIFFTIFGDQLIGEGEQVDLWYSSNPSALFKNRFSKDTRPNTLTNTGANSLITFSDFSDISNRMSFKLVFGDSILKPLFTHNINTFGSIETLSAITNDMDYTVYYGMADSNLIILNEFGFLDEINSFSRFKSAGFIKGATNYIYGVNDSTLNIATISEDSIEGKAINLSEWITAAPTIINSVENQSEMIIATIKDTLLLYEGRLNYYDISNDPNNPVLKKAITIPIEVEKISAEGDFYGLLGNLISMELIIRWHYLDNFGTYEFVNEQPLNLILTKDSKGNYFSIIITNSLLDTDVCNFYGLRGDEILFKFTVNAPVELSSFALTDLRQDGSNYIILNNYNKIEAYNLTGAMADNFPFIDPLGIGFAGVPLAANFEGDSKSEIISVTKDGRIFSIDGGTGKVVDGFPISSGSPIFATPVLYNANEKTNLAVMNDQDVFSAWSISSVEGNLYWSEEYGNPKNSSFVDAAKNTNRINEFFPKNRAYNYPNPVYDGQTYIRYYVSEDSKINIKIFDLAGGYVSEMNDDARGGMDNETIWNVNDIQSGVYLARIEAVSNSGRSESQVIKIAVVK